MDLIRQYQVASAKEYIRFRSGSEYYKNILPAQPSVYYKEDWNGWSAFTGIHFTTSDVNIDEVHRTALKMDIRTKEEWRLAVSRNLINGPLHISKVEGFSNWSQFLTEKKYLSFSELLTFTRSLGLFKQTDWREWCRNNEKPNEVPFDLSKHYQENFKQLKPAIKGSFWKYIFVG